MPKQTTPVSLMLCLVAGSSLCSSRTFAQSGPGAEAPIAPIAGTVNGAVPATVLNGGDTVTVMGSSVPALRSDGLTGGVQNSITVLGGGITATNLAGTGLGVITAMNGGLIDLGTGTLVQAQGSGSAAGIIGATGLYTRYLAGGGQVPTIIARDLTVSASSDKPYAVYAHTDGLITLTGLTTISTFSNGTQGWGLVSNANGRITAENVNITMGGIAGVFGNFQVAISAYSGAHTSVSGTANVNVTGLEAEVLFSRYANSQVTINNITGTAVSTSGSAVAAGAGSGGVITVNGNASLSITAATEATGLEVSNGGSVSFLGTSNLTIGGPTALGFRTVDGGDLTL